MTINGVHRSPALKIYVAEIATVVCSPESAKRYSGKAAYLEIIAGK